MDTIEKKSVATIRTLSIDAIEKANSGHPGMPMGAAPMAYTLWTKFMNVSPANPGWFNRDRFVLSAGHGSALLYSMLHLSGFDLSIEDLKGFRQWGSKTPGHPEFGHTAGVDATTGPLGQGIAMAVGMAIAERHLAETYNRDSFNVVDHYTYSICGDGDLMEGISSEAASLAGHLQLGRLIVLYDSNDISLDGDLDRSFSENVKQRFEAMNWEVLYVEDGNNIEELTAAIEKARQNEKKPTLIEVKTTIGFGSPNRAGTSGVHGAPLGKEESKLTKEASFSLKTIDLSSAYATWSGVGTALTAIVGFLLFGETISLKGVFGLTLVIAGVVVLNQSKAHAEDKKQTACE